MSIKILADSCLDTTPQLREQLDVELVPLTIYLREDVEFIDDLSLDTGKLLKEMAASKNSPKTACPSVEEYAKRMKAYDECIVITLSSKLSGSYNAARLACEMVCEEYPNKKIHVVDSESAAAGQLRIALLIDELRAAGADFDTIVEKAEALKRAMHTLFVLEDLSNLVKNGRMSKVKGLAASVLSLHPVLSDDGAGEIKQLSVVRGMKNALSRLVDTVAEITVGEPDRSRLVTLTQCNCPKRAEDIKYDILVRCHAIRDVIIAPAAGISTVYANNGGVVLAF